MRQTLDAQSGNQAHDLLMPAKAQFFDNVLGDLGPQGDEYDVAAVDDSLVISCHQSEGKAVCKASRGLTVSWGKQEISAVLSVSARAHDERFRDCPYANESHFPLFFLMIRPTPRSTLFTYTTLFLR